MALQGLEVAVELCTNEARVVYISATSAAWRSAGKPPFNGSLIVPTA